MSWDGIERRGNQKVLGFCPAHIEFVADIAVIKSSLANIEKTITQGINFKNAVMMGFVSIAVTIVIQIVAFAFLFGQINKQVSVNTDRLGKVEDILYVKK